MGHCDKCKGAVEDIDLAACDLCKVRLCNACSTLTQTEIRAVNVKKRRLLKYHCLGCAGKRTADLSACLGSDFEGLGERILAGLMERIEPLITQKYSDLSTKIENNGTEIIMLRESNIQLLHLLNPSVTGRRCSPGTTSILSKDYRVSMDDDS